VRERVYALYPPEAIAWAIGQGIPQPPPAPEEPVPAGEDAPASVAAPIEVVSPFQRDRYRISAELPREDQRLMIEARAGGQAGFARVTLNVDGQALASYDAPPYQTWWSLEPGEHEIEAIGETADGERFVSEAIVVIVNGGMATKDE
jgi:hypothetical protein